MEKTEREKECYTKALAMLETIFSGPFIAKDIDFTPTGFDMTVDIKVTRLYQSGKFIILYAEYKKGSVYSFHKHSDSLEHIVCISGQFQVDVKQSSHIEKHVLHVAECLTIPVGVEHEVVALEDSEVLAICIPPELAYCDPKR